MSLSLAAAALKKYFGYDSFRTLQSDIIQAVYDRRDTLVLMPTGGGKSICYQIPAITLDGVAIVVSPLIALMKDQVEGLSANGIPAAFINSSLSPAQQKNVEDALMGGYIKLLYVSPEKMVSQSFQPLLKRLKVSLFAIDEAHCISAWGHDFRPEYTQLKFLKQQFPQVPLIALTATADKITRRDIVAQLGMADPTVFISSFDRPNISLKVAPGQRRFEQIVAFLKQHPRQSGIIYCLARKACADLSDKLNALGFKTDYYHAELSPAQRSKVQEDFINDRTPIICATIAFGMGIDKSNVRFVIHYNLPRNVEGYYQEVGRAGRDGLPSEALLFFSYADVTSYRDMFEQGEGSPEAKELKMKKLERMYQFAEAPVCRRRTVLAYFDENYDHDCGNCDVCLNPPRSFDGTVAAQKALSALIRVGEKVGMNLLIDVLRGSGRREIMEQGYHQIKTYGAGKEYSYDEWLFLISQMLHLGLIEIAYDERNVLRVTAAGRAVLFEGKKVSLALPQPKLSAEEKKAAAKEKLPPALRPKSQREVFREELFE
ncbi:MAG TPA: DNA helicase RecQ, partial [Saprospiraceae bacterium]|nr:DNA helicase RecQ [Saprospiraceae bacterium]